MPEASIGRIVHFVLGDGYRSAGESRPAQIVAVFPQPDGPPLVNIVVTLDGLNDLEPADARHNHDYVRREVDAEAGYLGENHRTWGGPLTLHRWETSVAHATAVGSPPTYPPGTWHWPPGVS